MSKKKAGKTLQPGKKYSSGVPQKAIQPSPLSGIQPDLNQKLELATEGSAQVDEILPAVVEFIDAFYWVFHLDWITTKRFISDADAQKIHDTLFGKEGTFAKPTIADASKDWLNRGRLSRWVELNVRWVSTA